jgi:hypothetical protein
MAAKINKNRYRLITLLYLVFVCLSVLNVPTSLFQSNLYVIKTFENQESIINNDLKINNQIIENISIDSNNEDYVYLFKNAREAYMVLDSVDNQIQNKLKKDLSDIDKDFNSRRKIESYLQKDGLLDRIKFVVFDYSTKIRAKKAISDTTIIDLIPIRSIVKSHSGKDVEWDQYLFLHKPLGISYMQLKRLKVAFLQEELMYQKKIVSISNLKDNVNELGNVSKSKLANPINSTLSFSTFDKMIADITENKINQYIKSSNNYSDSIVDKQKQLEAILSSLRIDKLYAGVQNTILTEFSSSLLENVKVSVSSNAEIIKNKQNYKISFPKTGVYSIIFSEKNDNGINIIFEKKLKVYSLPDPIVTLNVKNLQSGIVSKRTIINSTRLLVSIPNSEFDSFPGRINGFRCVKYNINNVQETVYNYGENFQSSILLLLANAQKGDIIVFDNITVSLNDGSSRTAVPLIYKISE